MPAEQVEKAWLRGNVIARMERAALAAAVVDSGEFDDRGLYNVDGGYEGSDGSINAVIQPDCHLDTRQEALFRSLIARIHGEVIGGPSGDECYNNIASPPLVGLLQDIIRGVVALPHDQRAQMAHRAVDKMEGEERTRVTAADPPQPREHLMAFAQRVAEDIDHHVALVLDILERP